MRRGAVLVLLLAACTGGPAGPAPLPAGESGPSPSSPRSVGAATTVTTIPAVDAAPGLGDRMFPELGNAGYDVDSYDIDLTFAAALGHLEGVVTLAATAEVPLRSFTVDFVGYTVRSVQVDGEDAAFVRGPRDMRISPRTAIPAGVGFEVTVAYAGVPDPVTLTDFAFPTGWRTGEGGSLFLFSEPDGASGVFPANDHPRDRADITLTVTVPADEVVVSAGTSAPVLETDDTRTFRFRIPEIAPYLLPLAIGDFRPVTTADGVVTWMGSGARLPAGFERQAEVRSALEADLGPLPFARIDAVVVDTDFPAALETQTLVTYTTTSAGGGTGVIAHELAHHWFGNAIGLGQWDDIWLNEGPATFMTWRWIEVDRGRAAYVAEAERAWNSLAVGTAPPPDHPPGQELFHPAVYQRGALALVALREFVGDEEFFDFLGAYVAMFSGDVVTTEAFLTFVLVVLGPAAEDVVLDWIRSEELPPFPLPG